MPAIPPSVSAFVLEHLSSITQLDILLRLRAGQGRAVDPEALGRELRVPPRFVTAQLADLARTGVVVADDGDPPAWRYDPAAEHARTVDELADLVARRKRAVHNLILSGPSDDVQMFSDAFRLRKDK